MHFYFSTRDTFINDKQSTHNPLVRSSNLCEGSLKKPRFTTGFFVIYNHSGLIKCGQIKSNNNVLWFGFYGYNGYVSDRVAAD